ncbi:MAG: hypothetical protein BGP01_12825 [Paludibacter sp. 47-17]|jgi:hypothetical protein|nr:MAG: hypothetical protein BGP01_12825 [Paludibacter sp. 47-17]
MATTTDESVCCPPFDPAPWDDKVIEWTDKLFVKQKVVSFWYIPLNFGKVMTMLMKATEKHHATVPDWLCLSDHTSKWNMDLYLAVDRELPGFRHVKLSGKYYTRVYEGDFSQTGAWGKEYEQQAKERSLKTGKLYMWYTTCPACAKKYGKNYVVFFGEIL